MRPVNWKRAILTTLVAHVAVFEIGATLLWGNPLTQRLILTPGYGQSQKLINVWRSWEPLPKVQVGWERMDPSDTGMLLFAGGVFLFMLVHVLIYSQIGPILPGPRWRRGLWFGLLIWILSYAWFEFMTPWNLFGEPLHLLLYELFIWLLLALGEGLVIAWVYRAVEEAGEESLWSVSGEPPEVRGS